MIVQNIGQDQRADISFTVPRDELKEALLRVNEAAKVVSATGVTHDEAVSKISVVGLGMANQTGVAEKMFAALADAGINIQMITTSEIKISVLVKRSEAQAALRAVHQVFSLHVKPDDARKWIVGQNTNVHLSASDVVERLRNSNMEQLTLLDIDLVGDQARVTLLGVPDTPGLANAVFRKVSKRESLSI